METYRYREGEPEPEGWPHPTQSRADFIKARVSGATADDVDPLAPPRNKDVPHLGGTAAVGGTLNCTMGNWTGEPTSYAYEWRADDAPVSAVGPDYVVTAADAGKGIVCLVTATNANGSTTAPPSNVVAIP